MSTLYCRWCSICNFCCEKFAQVMSRLPRACMEYATTMKQLLYIKFILFTSTLPQSLGWELVPVSIPAEHEHWINLCELGLCDMLKEPVPGQLLYVSYKNGYNFLPNLPTQSHLHYAFQTYVSLEELPTNLSRLIDFFLATWRTEAFQAYLGTFFLMAIHPQCAQL